MRRRTTRAKAVPITPETKPWPDPIAGPQLWLLADEISMRCLLLEPPVVTERLAAQVRQHVKGLDG
jgi:hypothetical protein